MEKANIKGIGKITGAVAASLLGASLIIPQASHEAQAVGSYDYNGLHQQNSQSGLQYAQQFSNNSISINHVKNPKKAGYEAIGRVSNLNGWKGAGKDSMGTGFIIGNHTFATNAHVVETKAGNQANPQHVKIVTERNGKAKKYTFNAKKIEKVPGADMVLVHTHQDMSKHVKPLKLASEKEINGLKLGSNFKAPGYDIVQGNDNTKLWESHGKALMTTTDGHELMTKQIFRAGGSGSPMLTKDNKVLGISAYGYNLRGNSPGVEAQNELAGGFKMTGSVRDFVNKHIN